MDLVVLVLSFLLTPFFVFGGEETTGTGMVGPFLTLIRISETEVVDDTETVYHPGFYTKHYRLIYLHLVLFSYSLSLPLKT